VRHLASEIILAGAPRIIEQCVPHSCDLFIARYITLPRRGGERSIAISVSVCLSVRSHISETGCCLWWPWLGPPVAVTAEIPTKFSSTTKTSSHRELQHCGRQYVIYECFIFVLFLARDVIYTSRAYATMSVSDCLSVRLSVCDGSALAHYS